MTDETAGLAGGAATTSTAERRFPIGWVAGGLLILACAPLAAFAVLRDGVSAFAPYQIALAYGVTALSATGVVIAFGAARKRISAWTLAIGSAGLLALAAALTHLPEGPAFADGWVLAMHLLAFAPSAAAVWARPLSELAREPERTQLSEKGIRRTIAGLSGVAAIQALSLCGIDGALGQDYAPWVMPSLFAAAMLIPLASARMLARLDQKLPFKLNEKPPYGHITSLGILTLILFIGVIAWLGLWSASSGSEAQQITKDTGIWVVAGLAVTFAVVAVAPTLSAVSGALTSATLMFETRLGFVSKFFTRLDAFLVFAIAPVLGATQPKRVPRYLLLFGHLFACGLLGWLLPAPYGLAPLAWAFVAVLAIARRWAWVEDDRENAMLNRRFSGDHIKIGFSNDLRDEALLGFMSLFFIVPFVLRQLHYAHGETLFVLATPQTADDVMAWISFFGTELAKAVPFVDWAEIYQVEGRAPIAMTETVGDAQHAVFAMRVVVDLVFLAALLQALSSLNRSDRLRKMFDDGVIDRLDPFAENDALRALAEPLPDGKFRLNEDRMASKYWSYDEDRLEELSNDDNADPAIRFVANEIIKHNREASPDDLLADTAGSKEPSDVRLLDLVEKIRDRTEPPNIERLKRARYLLRGNAKLWRVRDEITRLIGDHRDKPGAVDALCEILLRGDGQDWRHEVRLTALRALYLSALLQQSGVAREVIRSAATPGNDASVRLTNAAREMLERHPDWFNGGGDPPVPPSA